MAILAMMVSASLPLVCGAAPAASGSGESDLFTLNTRYLSPVDGDGVLPHATTLGASHPNPFNPSTTIEFTLGDAASVDLSVYDVTGRLVRRLIDGRQLEGGGHTATWNGRDAQGRVVSAGVYLYRLKAGDFIDTRRTTLIK